MNGQNSSPVMQFYRVLRIFMCFCLCLCVLPISFSSSVSAEPQSAVYTVDKVEVDVSAENASVAREQAFSKAQILAFDMLIKRILTQDQKEKLIVPGLEEISAMVLDFEITNEKVSSVRYVGNYTFRFKKNAIHTLLNGQGIAYTDVESRPVLVLPFYEEESGAQIIWSDPNPWRMAWSETPSFDGLVPTILPIGDLEDVAAIDDGRAMTYDPLAVSAMADRYDSANAVIVIAVPEFSNASDSADLEKKPSSLNVTIYSAESGTPQHVAQFTVTEDEAAEKNDPAKTEDLSGLDSPDIFSRAVAQAKEALQQGWKARASINSAQQGALRIQVPINSMTEWVETQKALKNVQGIENIKLVFLSPKQAILDLSFRGDEPRLRLALSQADLVLSEGQSSAGSATYEYGAPAYYSLYLKKFEKAE